MSYSPYWVICPAAQVEEARQHAQGLGWSSEFTVPMSAAGELPATHYGGHGQIIATGDDVGRLPWLQAYVQQNSLQIEFIPSDAVNAPAVLLAEKSLRIIPKDTPYA